MHIGPHIFGNPWILAPMAGVSEMPFRVLARQMGAAAAPTELVSAKGLLYGQARTARYLTHDDRQEQPFWVQIFGGDAASMAEGALHAVRMGAAIIDINMGCPVKKVTTHGAGSALLCDPARAAALVDAIAQRAQVPVTCKIRMGWDAHTLNFVEVAQAVQAAGCSAIAMHARTRAQGYSGSASWPAIAELVRAVNIPVIGNGDVKTPQDAHRMRRETGCAAVMIGRAALGNPWIFEQLTQPDALPPTPSQRWSLIEAHLERHLRFCVDLRQGVRRFRSHLMWYAHGLQGAAAFRRRVMQIEPLAEILAACREFFGMAEASPASQAIDFDERSALG